MVSQSRNAHDTSDTPCIRQRLIEVALLAFSEKGFDGVGIRELAHRAKANPAMIAYHFGSKEGLYEVALKWAAEDFFVKFQENMPAAPDPNIPDAKDFALSALKTYLKKAINLLMRPYFDRQSDGLYQAAHKLWLQESQDPREGLLDFIIERITSDTNRFFSYLKILRPELSLFELNAMVISIRGPIMFFQKNFKTIQRIHGQPFTDDDMERLVQHFIDFSLRGIGVSDPLVNEGA